MSRGRVQGMIIAGFAGVASSFYAFQPVIREHSEAQQRLPRLSPFCSDRDGAKDVVPSQHDGKAAAPHAEKPKEGSTGSDQIKASGGASRGQDS